MVISSASVPNDHSALCSQNTVVFSRAPISEPVLTLIIYNMRAWKSKNGHRKKAFVCVFSNCKNVERKVFVFFKQLYEKTHVLWPQQQGMLGQAVQQYLLTCMHTHVYTVLVSEVKLYDASKKIKMFCCWPLTWKKEKAKSATPLHTHTANIPEAKRSPVLL